MNSLYDKSKAEIELLEKIGYDSLKKIKAGQPVQILDFAPEFESLKGKSYTLWRPPGNPENANVNPRTNLNILLASNYYDNILVPLDIYDDKRSFINRYGLLKNSGCRINYQQFLDFISDGKLKVINLAGPHQFTQNHHKEIFKACENAGYFPPSMNTRLGKFFELFNAKSVDIIDGNKLQYEIDLKFTKKYCREELQQLLDENSRKKISSRFHVTENSILDRMVSRIHSLRNYGFETLAEIVLTLCKKDIVLGYSTSLLYHNYLIQPFSQGIGGYSIYDLNDIKGISFLRLLDKDMLELWNDILNFSPANSSLISEDIAMTMPTLTGEELLKFLDRDSEQELKDNVAGIKNSLNSYNLVEARKTFERVSEIITERYNKELEDYGKMEKKANLLINFGKTYTSISDIALAGSFYDGFKTHFGSWTWMPNFLTANWLISQKIKNRLDKLTTKDIVSWCAKKWPFHDPGISFTLWRHGVKKLVK